MYSKRSAAKAVLATSLLVCLVTPSAAASPAPAASVTHMARQAAATPQVPPPPPGTVAPAYWWAGATLVALLLLTTLTTLAFKARIRRQAERLRASQARVNTILDSVDAYIYIKDTQLRYVYGNRQLCEYFGRSPQTLIGATDGDFLPAAVLNHVRSTDLRVIRQGERVVSEDEFPPHNGGQPSYYLSIKIPLRGADGGIEALCGITTDITELRNSRKAIQQLAYYDPLTDLPNRRLLQERLEEAMLRQKDGDPVAGLLFVDLDKFKNINDERGHDVGDAVLCAIARRLTGVAHPADTVARLGGDEFVILLHNLGPTAAGASIRALDIAETVRRALAKPVTIQNESHFTGGSIGITLLDPHTKTVADVLREADMAMYQAKEQGRNRVALYVPAMQERVAHRAALRRDLVTVFDTEQFQLLVQPQYDRQRQVIGAELLLRWDHPTRGTIMPDTLLGLAEESGLMQEVGEWSLKQACRLHARLASSGRAHPISINISASQLHDPDFHTRTRAVLEEAGTPPGQIILELTENVLIDDVEDAARRMKALAELGLRFSIDGFGTGYSGLAYLQRLPLYELKIARSFVQELPDKDTATLIRLIIATARLLELRVVAEGVEKAQQADYLTAIGCDALQGYFYQRPIPIDTWLGQPGLPDRAGAAPTLH